MTLNTKVLQTKVFKIVMAFSEHLAQSIQCQNLKRDRSSSSEILFLICLLNSCEFILNFIVLNTQTYAKKTILRVENRVL